MQVKALISFSGIISMVKNEVREIKDKVVYDDLLKAGYIEEVKQVKASRKKVTSDEN